MDPLTLLEKYGWPVGSLLIAIGAFYWDLIVTGVRFRTMEADYQKRLEKAEVKSDQWQQLALELGGVSRSALSIAERHVPRGGP